MFALEQWARWKPVEAFLNREGALLEEDTQPGLNYSKKERGLRRKATHSRNNGDLIN